MTRELFSGVNGKDTAEAEKNVRLLLKNNLSLHVFGRFHTELFKHGWRYVHKVKTGPLSTRATFGINHDKNPMVVVVGVVWAGIVFISVDGVKTKAAHGPPKEIAKIDD